MRFFKNKFQCARKKEILFMSTITIRKKEYFYLSTFTIKQKKNFDYSKCYYLLETLYVHIEENSLISNQKKKQKRGRRTYPKLT